MLLRAVTCDGVDPRLTNGPAKLCRHLGIDMAMNGDPATVFDDGVKDTLYGEAGQDWFWIGIKDKIKDLQPNEQVN